MCTKTVVSVSLGSPTRDKETTQVLLGQSFYIRREGMGDFRKARDRLQELDGTVDALGLGGFDIYLRAGDKRYELRDGKRLRNVVKHTPIADGTGLKDTLERETIWTLAYEGKLRISDATVLLPSALDRFGMMETFETLGARIICADKLFCLDLDQIMYSSAEVRIEADRLLPDIAKMPASFVYPTGRMQEQEPQPTPQTDKYYAAADIIAGDFHLIRKRLPKRLTGKVIITNTTTSANIEELRERGVRCVVTTTPNYEGRSFGTNVLEACMTVLLQKKPDDITPAEYGDLIKQLKLQPNSTWLQ